MPTSWACASPRAATPTARCTTRWASTIPGDDDLVVPEGIALVVSPAERELLDGMTLDYVEYEAGDFRFIFVNPNDVAPAPHAPGLQPGWLRRRRRTAIRGSGCVDMSRPGTTRTLASMRRPRSRAAGEVYLVGAGPGDPSS